MTRSPSKRRKRCLPWASTRLDRAAGELLGPAVGAEARVRRRAARRGPGQRPPPDPVARRGGSCRPRAWLRPRVRAAYGRDDRPDRLVRARWSPTPPSRGRWRRRRRRGRRSGRRGRAGASPPGAWRSCSCAGSAGRGPAPRRRGRARSASALAVPKIGKLRGGQHERPARAGPCAVSMLPQHVAPAAERRAGRCPSARRRARGRCRGRRGRRPSSRWRSGRRWRRRRERLAVADRRDGLVPVTATALSTPVTPGASWASASLKEASGAACAPV